MQPQSQIHAEERKAKTMTERIPSEAIPKHPVLSEMFAKEITEADRKLLVEWETGGIRDSILKAMHWPKSAPYRWKLPEERASVTHRFVIPSEKRPLKGYLTMGMYGNGQLGEIFLRMAKEGSFVSGIMDALMFTLSVGLQHGIPLATFTRRFKHSQFQPSGIVKGAPSQIAGFAASIMDYLAKYLDLTFPEGKLQSRLAEFKQEQKKEPNVMENKPAPKTRKLKPVAA